MKSASYETATEVAVQTTIDSRIGNTRYSLESALRCVTMIEDFIGGSMPRVSNDKDCEPLVLGAERRLDELNEMAFALHNRLAEITQKLGCNL